VVNEEDKIPLGQVEALKAEVHRLTLENRVQAALMRAIVFEIGDVLSHVNANFIPRTFTDPSGLNDLTGKIEKRLNAVLKNLDQFPPPPTQDSWPEVENSF
jgi:hypothetical protein